MPKRSYLNPKFEFDIRGKSAAELKDMAAWNVDLVKRKVQKVFLQRQADKEWADIQAKKKKKPGLVGSGRQSRQLKDLEKEGY